VAVASRLQELRAERNWTQAQLAVEVGVSRQTINSIETGRFEPSLSLALKLGRLFEMPVESIFSLE
jgi:putative transcriptional regulator